MSRPRRHHHAPQGDQISTLARDALFDVHRLSGFRRERGRIQSDGPRRVRAADDDRRGSQVDPAHAGRRLRPRSEILRVSDDGEAVVFAAIRRAVRAAAEPVRTDRPRNGGRAAFRGLRRERAAGARRHPGGHHARAAPGNRSSGSVSQRRRGAQWRRERADSRRIRLRARVRAVRSGRRRLCARRGAVCRSHVFRQRTTAMCPIIRSWGRRWTAGNWRRRRGKTTSSSRSWPKKF